MSKLKDALLNGLQKLSRLHTIETLGDRSSYLGASEIGACPRKTILSKITPREYDLPTLLRFERGHMAEDVVANALNAAGFSNFERQVVVSSGDLPVTAHIDFVFTSETSKTKSILEVKSPEKTPLQPYSSWETQLYIQMGLLAQAYPGYTVDKGAILSLNMGGEVELFNGYTPVECIFNGLMERAEGIWRIYRQLACGENNEELATEVTPLCGYCEHFATCPRFDADDAPELADTVKTLVALQARQKAITKEIDSLKEALLVIASQRGPFKVNDCYLREATRSKKVFDMARLESFLSGYGTSAGCFQESRPYSFLEIKSAACS